MTEASIIYNKSARIIEVGGTSFYAADTHHSFWNSVSNDDWETDTLAFLKDHILPGMVFFDIGAWIGPISLYAAAQGADVKAFEPHPDSFKLLEHSVSLNSFADRIKTYNYGLWHKDTTLSLHSSDKTSGATVVERNNKDMSSYEIACKKITFLEEICDDRPIFLKMDIEGAEYDIISDLIKFAKIQKAQILLSTHPHKIRSFPKLSWKLPFKIMRYILTILKFMNTVHYYKPSVVEDGKGKNYIVRAARFKDYFYKNQLYFDFRSDSK